jgi:hypothetical protein
MGKHNFLYKLLETPVLLQIMEMQLLNSTLYKWYAEFRNSQESLENGVCSGRPALLRNNKNLAKVGTVMTSDGCVMM